MEKEIRKYSRLYREALKKKQYADIEKKTEAYRIRLTDMYASEAFRKHNIYPTMNVTLIYAVIAMCLELKEYGRTDAEIMAFSDTVFAKRKKTFEVLEKCINVLPNSWQIARKWNISDHDKRIKDGSITYDVFDVSEGKIEYRISKCMYVEMFRYYGIRSLCKIFCITDENAYANLPKHVRFIRHSDLSDGECCHDEVIRKKTLGS